LKSAKVLAKVIGGTCMNSHEKILSRAVIWIFSGLQFTKTLAKSYYNFTLT